MATPLKPPPTELSPPPAQVESKRADQLRIAASISALDHEHRRSWQRLDQQVAAIKRRSTIELVIGVTATAIAVGILLAPIVFGISPDTYSAVRAYLVMRAPVCFLLEAFSFYFLRHSYTSWEKATYYQNELTNLDDHFTGLRQAVQSNDKVALRAAVAAFVKTDRNFTLKKGESTVELERSRMEAQSPKDLVEMVVKMMREGK